MVLALEERAGAEAQEVAQRIKKEYTTKKVENHNFKIIKKKESEKWMKSRK